MGPSSGGRRRLVVVWLLAFALSAVADHRHTAAEGRRPGEHRPRRGLKWQYVPDEGPSGDAAHYVHFDDGEDDEDVDVAPPPQVEHAFQEQLLLDRLAPHVAIIHDSGKAGEPERLMGVESRHEWLPKALQKQVTEIREQEEDLPARDTEIDAGSAPSATLSTRYESPRETATTGKTAGGDGGCAADGVQPRPLPRTTAAHTKHGGLMHALLRTKSTVESEIVTTSATKRTRATKKAGTRTSRTSKATTTTAPRTTTLKWLRTSTAMEARKPAKKIASAVQAPPSDDSGAFVVNRFAHVSRESAYMEHMEPMTEVACRVHLWIIGILLALLLLMTVAYCVSIRPRTEPPPPPAPPPVVLSPVSPFSPSTPPPAAPKRPYAEMWEDDLYNVSEISKSDTKPSLTQAPPPDRVYRNI